MGEFVEIFEVGPRDGFQNEAEHVDLKDKIALVDLLSQAGFKRIEVASFVSPKWVPQMAGSADVLAGIQRAPGTSYAALTPNLRGLRDARSAGAGEVAVFVSASEGFSQANTNCSVAEGLSRASEVASASDVPVRGYVSCVVECPFDGLTDPARVLDCAQALLDMGCYEVSLGDTIGRATPDQVKTLLETVTGAIAPAKLAGHFHDTSGGAVANIDVALGFRLRVFDAAVGGLGGCPYAPGAAGNVATETVLAHLTAQGYDTGLDGSVVAEAAQFAKSLRGNAHV